jgi:hypothetical protein
LFCAEQVFGTLGHATIDTARRARDFRSRSSVFRIPYITVPSYYPGGFGYFDKHPAQGSSLSWWIWEILDKYPALVLHYSGGVRVLLRFCVIIIFCALN